MCEWSLACCGCIGETAVDCRNQYSLTAWCAVTKFENVSFSKFATSCMMQARLEGMDDSA